MMTIQILDFKSIKSLTLTFDFQKRIWHTILRQYFNRYLNHVYCQKISTAMLTKYIYKKWRKLTRMPWRSSFQLKVVENLNILLRERPLTFSGREVCFLKFKIWSFSVKENFGFLEILESPYQLAHNIHTCTCMHGARRIQTSNVIYHMLEGSGPLRTLPLQRCT